MSIKDRQALADKLQMKDTPANYYGQYGIYDVYYYNLLDNAIRQNKTLYTNNNSEYVSISDRDILKEIAAITKLTPFYEVETSMSRSVYFASEDLYLVLHLGDGGKSAAKSWTFHTTNPEFHENLRAFFTKIKRTVSTYATVKIVAQGDRGLYLHDFGSINHKLETGNYSDETIKDYHYVKNELKRKDPRGRLVILNGKPGVGKSWLTRALLSEMKEEIVVILPPRLVAEIDSPSLGTLMMREKSHTDAALILLLEDADNCLVPRAADNMSTISSLLNLTDGIFGSLLDVRIIATTNAESIDFDSAITRPGRLLKHMYLDLLSPQKAGEVYKRLSGKEKKYDKETSLASVYQDFTEGENNYAEKTKKQVVGF